MASASSRVEKYRELVAWQRSMELVSQVYRATSKWPREEQYGLTNQTRRAAVSVPANIAEGQGRTGVKELAHHLSIAQGSLAELETLLLIAEDLRYIEAETCRSLLAHAAEAGRLIGGLIRSLRVPPA